MLTRQNNFLITGIPRSGTTLTAALIDSVPNAVCLNEPAWQAAWMQNNPNSTAGDFAQWLIGDYVVTRNKLRRGIGVSDRRARDGSALTNYFKVDTVTREMEKAFHIQSITRNNLTPDFILAMKHNGVFISALPEIIDVDQFAILAIIRHPLAVIRSWRRLDLPVSHGRIPAAEFYWPEMRELVNSNLDLLIKQVLMYDLHLKRYSQLQQHLFILRYEEMVTNPHCLLRHLGVAPETLVHVNIQPYKAPVPESSEDEHILDILARHCEYYRYFYPELVAV